MDRRGGRPLVARGVELFHLADLFVKGGDLGLELVAHAGLDRGFHGDDRRGFHRGSHDGLLDGRFAGVFRHG